mmetsp:Transcript_52111/g.93397  ORF Transcript_52111/g.93397 Transcript_52111/m.93397 type:complete len:243 (-) Transcript_52111:130-858(-)
MKLHSHKAITSASTIFLAAGAAAGALAWRRVAVTSLLACFVLHSLNAFSKVLQLARKRQSGMVRREPSVSNGNFQWQEVKPPLPQAVVMLLQQSRLGYLSTATTDGETASPHLSLMTFTYVQEDEVIIMTTRKDTQKYHNLLSLSRVAMLVHDFPTIRTEDAALANKFTKTYSITLYGTVSLAADKAQEEHYRQLHLENNPNGRCFIIGDNIAVLVLSVNLAKLCNSEDKVTTWSVEGDASP